MHGASAIDYKLQTNTLSDFPWAHSSQAGSCLQTVANIWPFAGPASHPMNGALAPRM